MFAIDDIGVFLVLRDHDAVTPFDPDLEVGGLPAYKKIFAPIGTAIARIQFQYPGVIPADSSLLWKFIQDDTRNLVIAETFANCVAHIEVAVTSELVFEFKYAGDVVGTLTFAVGVDLDGDGGQFGVFAGDGATIAQNELLRMYAPGIDGAATYLNVSITGSYVAP